MSRQNSLLSRVYPANSTHTPPFRAAGTPCMTCRQTHATPRAVDRSPLPLRPHPRPLPPSSAWAKGRHLLRGQVGRFVSPATWFSPARSFPSPCYFPFSHARQRRQDFPGARRRPRPFLALVLPRLAPPPSALTLAVPPLPWQPPSGAIRAYIYLEEPRPLPVMSAMAFSVGRRVTRGLVIYLFCFLIFYVLVLHLLRGF